MRLLRRTDQMKPGMTDATDQPGFERNGDTLALRGELTTARVGALWNPVLKAGKGAGVVDLSRVSALDTTGAAMVLDAAGEARLEGASESVTAVLKRAQDALAAPRPAKAGKGLPFVAAVGSWGVGRLKSVRAGAGFMGEAVVLTLALLRHPRRLRFADVLRHLDEAG
jgi:phospholipid/cholesterol/gamma-HCH transport system permease protein